MIFALSATKNFYKYLPINVFNILRTNPCEKIYIFIEDDALNLPFTNAEIVYINMHKIGLNKEGANYNTSFSIATLCRLYLAQLVTEDKIIYCDMDALVVGNLTQLWDLDMGNYYVAGVVDQGILDYEDYIRRFANPETYINTGVLLMNLKKIREDNKTPELIDYVNQNKLIFPDQDAINWVFKDKILIVDQKFNASQATGIPHKFLIFHWAGLKQDWVYNREYSYLWTRSERDFIEIFARPVEEKR